ncbi:hypothetical protein AYO21_01204 [Fonsecaea monophora]|uniref:Uncharacterized protein n=1 Tax=Fonsecaea monophora TaxID=254056 RepID=A0A177FK88_9EURO|nr:hypothetical protein AYO21_01204 [Fonsecaea monophora]OAG44714.1 hypothetical protein AYO21_01204 [Fonsecaea monophora]
MLSPVFVSLLAVLLSWPTVAIEQKQKNIGLTKTQEPDPTITASVKSIFSSFSRDEDRTFDPKSASGCCNSTCALGLCNGIYPFDTTPPPDAARTATASPAIATESCCSAGCPDGFCRGFERFRHWWPIGCVGRGCAVPTGQRWNHLPPHLHPGSRCEGRDCSPGVHQSDSPITTIFADAVSGAVDAVKPTDTAASSPKAANKEPTLQFHSAELAGQDQDTLPIIVENNAKEPVTLLADIDLALTENYISSGMLSALGLSSTSSRLSPIAKEDQRAAALGTPAFHVTPHAKISLNLLAGPKVALNQFADVAFNVFDLPSIHERAGVPWEPEVFLGVVFLREASALRLVDGFSGHPALKGLSVVVRDIPGTDTNSARNQSEQKPAKDEL